MSVAVVLYVVKDIVRTITTIIVGVLALHLLLSVNTVHIDMSGMVFSNYEHNNTTSFDPEVVMKKGE